jgi:diguanylate cyclase (GGDEF)-like protein/PAS domain S-box-containing protein
LFRLEVGHPRSSPDLRADSPGGSLFLALLTLYSIAFVAWELQARASSGLGNILGNAGGLVPGAGAVWLCWRTSRSERLSPRGRRSWAWLTASLLLFWLGDVVFLLFKIAHWGASVDASVADLLYLASYPLALVALLRLRTGAPGSDERTAFWLDAGMVALGGGMLAWHAFIQPTLSGPAWSGESLTALAYVVGDLVLLAAFGITRIGASAPIGWPFVLLGLGLSARFAANALYWYDVLLGPPGAAGIGAAALFNVAWIAFALTAQARLGARAESSPLSPRSAAGFSLVPTLAAAIGYVVLAEAVARILSLDVGVVVFVGVGLTAAVLARQLVAVRAGARLAAERVTQQSEARFRSLVQNASDIVLLIGDVGEVRYHTPSADRFLDRSAGDLDGAPLRELVHPEDNGVVEALVRDATANPGTTPAAEWRMRWSGGGWHFVEARAKSVPDDPNLGGVILTLRSVHERKVLEERLAHQAFHDPLTHLANRVLLAERLEHALLRARRGGQVVSLVFVDLDDFKNVNDSFGHATGDQLLVELASRLLSCVRAGDTCARLGGDEFAVLVEEGGVEAARQIAERIRDAVREPFLVAGREIVLGASLGIAGARGGDESAGDLLRNADVAMYRAKHAGKGQVVVFEASMQTAVRERLELEAELRGALERGELRLVYQPIIALGSLRTVGAEALLRWEHPQRGSLRPGDFFAAAEAAGMMPAINAWVVEEACRRASGWPVIDEAGQLPLLCVNVSPRLLATRDFVEGVERAALASQLPPGRLVLELTEGAAVEDAPTTFAAMRRLRARGVRVAIDDFGTGYSSLSYLREMPVDILKLDKLFVDGVAGDSNAPLLTRGILDLARALGKLVVAEGIERPEQAERLGQYGCTLGQGFLFSEAIEADAFGRRLAADTAEPS